MTSPANTTSPWLDERMAPNGRSVRENFAEWFGDSKVVDNEGAPLVVFHGTAHPSWEEGRTAFGRTNGMGEGAYFAPSARLAADYAAMDSEVEGDPPFLIPVYLSIRNPKVIHDSIDMQEILPEQRAEWEALGHDGMMGYWGGQLAEIAVWNPSQIKSAVGNSGNFDASSECIADADPSPQLRRKPCLQP